MCERYTTNFFFYEIHKAINNIINNLNPFQIKNPIPNENNE